MLLVLITDEYCSHAAACVLCNKMKTMYNCLLALRESHIRHQLVQPCRWLCILSVCESCVFRARSFQLFVGMFFFPIMMVLAWTVVVGSSIRNIVYDKECRLEEVSRHKPLTSNPITPNPLALKPHHLQTTSPQTPHPTPLPSNHITSKPSRPPNPQTSPAKRLPQCLHHYFQ